MARRDYNEEAAYEEDLDDVLDEEEEEEEVRGRKGEKGGKASSSGGKKRARSDFIDDAAIEDDDENYGGGGGGPVARKKNQRGSLFFELEAEVDEDEEEEEEDDEGEDDFIDEGADLGDESDMRRMRQPAFIEEEHEEDVDEIERKVKEYYARSSHIEFTEDATDVEQQAFLPSVKDPKLWMVKCAISHEREVAICLMQKCIDRGDLQIRSVIALDHLKNYIYVEAEKEGHVKEACKGFRNIYASAKIMLVPIKEMTDVLLVESKVIDLAIDAWVRMKLGIYKGDLAKVVNVDNVRRRVTVKLVPRVDLQMIAHKLKNAEMLKKKTFVPPPRFFNKEEARELKLRVERRRGDSGEQFDCVEGLMFKDGFLYKTVSMKSISVNNIQPTFNELEKFRKPGEDTSRDLASLPTLFANRKKGHFMNGDTVIVVCGDLKDLEGWVVKVEEDTVHIKPKMPGLRKTLAFNEKELCKFFKIGDHVKVVSGVQEGATGMVVTVKGRVLIILSDSTKEHIRVFADHAVESSEITTGITQNQGEQQPVEHIHRGISFIHNQLHLEHAGSICAKAQSCVLVGGSNRGNGGDELGSRFGALRSNHGGPPSHFGGRGRFGGSGGRGHGNELVGKTVRIKSGPFKGYKGRVTEVKGVTIRIELDSQMKNVTVNRDQIADAVTRPTTPFWEPRYSLGGETPIHPSRTPLHPYQTPMRDPGATPIHDGMRTPMRNRYPMSPARDTWEEANPATWGNSSPAYHPGTPLARPYVPPTPGGNFNDAPRDSYASVPSPSCAGYLPGTPGQPLTPPGNVGMESPMCS